MDAIVSSGSDNVRGVAAQDGHEDQAAALYRLAMLAAELVDAIGDQATRDRESYETGWQAGWKAASEEFFQHGWEVGYGRAHAEMDEWWAILGARVRAMAKVPTMDERFAMDREYAAGVPCRSACGSCSRCIRADAFERHGGDLVPAEAAEAIEPLAKVIELKRGVA